MPIRSVLIGIVPHTRGMSATVKIVVGAVVAGIVGVAGFYFMQKNEPRKECSAVLPAPVIVAFGDSLIRGEGATTPGGFVSMLSKQTGVRITNLGESGNTTSAGLLRIDDVLQLQPSIVLVLLGGNDALRKVPQDQTEKNLDTIITRLEKEHVHVILLGVPGAYPFADPYADMFTNLSTSHNISFVPNVLSGIIGHPSLMSDVVHPNEAGYQMIADRVYPILTKVCAL